MYHCFQSVFSELPLPGSWLSSPDQMHSAFIRILQDLADEGSTLALTDKRAVSKVLQQRIRYYAKLAPTESSPAEEQFAKRYDFIVSDLVRRKVMPVDADYDDLWTEDKDDINGSVQNIRYWHANTNKNNTSADQYVSSIIRSESENSQGSGVTNGSATSTHRKSDNSTLQYRPESTPHMDAMGRYPAYYPQVRDLAYYMSK